MARRLTSKFTNDDPLDIMGVEQAAFEWANAKCRWAAYFGAWPAWVDAIEVPNGSDVALLLHQWRVKRSNGDWERKVKRITAIEYPTGVNP